MHAPIRLIAGLKSSSGRFSCRGLAALFLPMLLMLSVMSSLAHAGNAAGATDGTDFANANLTESAEAESAPVDPVLAESTAPTFADPALVDFRAELEQTLNAWGSMRARFSQTVLDSQGAVLERSTGTVAVLRPGRFRWQYEVPYRQLIVSDGERMQIYDEDLAQVSVGTLDAARDDPGARLLNERVALDTLFEVRRLPSRAGLDWARLDPRTEGATYRMIEVGMQDGALMQLRLADQFGQTTELTFSEVARDADLSDGLFSFVPPDGVDVVRMNE